MRKIIILILLFFNLSAFSQGREDKEYALYKIAYIRRTIDRYEGYTKVEIDDSEEFLGHATDNGGTLTGYYKNDSLKKIVEWVGLSNRIIENVYYFDKAELICVVSNESRYKYNDSTGTTDHSRTEWITGGKYYFNKGNFFDSIIRDKEKMKTKEADAKEFLKSASEYGLLLEQRRKGK
jgi:hypothetical protein